MAHGLTQLGLHTNINEVIMPSDNI